jgi:hypothetical protein
MVGSRVACWVVVLLAGAAPRALAVREEEEIYNRYHALLTVYHADLAAAEERYRRDYVGRLWDDWGQPIPEDRILPSLEVHLRRVLQSQLRLLGARDEHLARTITLDERHRRMRFAMEQGINAVAVQYLQEMTHQVVLLQHERSTRARELKAEFDAAAAALPRQGRDEALAALHTQYTAREQADLDDIVRRYGELTRATLERRRKLCGDAWAIVDWTRTSSARAPGRPRGRAPHPPTHRAGGS